VSRDTPEDSAGIVHIVGAGPGDPGLITVRGLDLIARADAIVFDSSVNRALLPAAARETGHPVLFFVGRSPGARRRVRPREIEELLIRLAREGKRVVRLTGGDPFVFGPGATEAEALYDASIPFEIVPGITAGVAALSYAGIPVTHPGMARSVTFVTGSDGLMSDGFALENYDALARAGGSIVVYAPKKTAASIAGQLVAGGMPGEIPAAAIEHGTRRSQRTVTATLATIADELKSAGIKGPTILVIGWPVILRDEMSWFENRPMFGKRILVAETSHAGGNLAGRLRDLGASVHELPAETVARLDLSPLRSAITTLSHFQWLIFTSRDAVIVFWEQLLGSGRDARALAGVAVAAAGAETAGALLEHGIAVDIIPERFTADSLIEKLRARDDVTGSRVLVIAPEGQHGGLAADLAEIGAEVTPIDAYRPVPGARESRRLQRAIERKTIDIVAFTSVGSVRAFVAAAGHELAREIRGASIGDAVSEALEEAGIEVACQAERPSGESLAAAIERELK
jgi:uroporphyrinogen III methyltransferase/synthase